jgi:hypothetical protein
MAEIDPPFIDNGEGYPTPESVHVALGMFSMGALAEVPVSYGGHRGSMTELITRCRIERLTENWPKGFIGQVVGAASQAAAQQAPEG